MTMDLSDGYSFPTHIAATDLRPDIEWWNDDQKTITLVELTVLKPPMRQQSREKMSGFCLSIAYIVCLHHPYIDSLVY